jgi:hypothetical protein
MYLCSINIFLFIKSISIQKCIYVQKCISVEQMYFSSINIFSIQKMYFCSTNIFLFNKYISIQKMYFSSKMYFCSTTGTSAQQPILLTVNCSSVIFTDYTVAFPLQQCLRERNSKLRHTYTPSWVFPPYFRVLSLMSYINGTDVCQKKDPV